MKFGAPIRMRRFTLAKCQPHALTFEIIIRRLSNDGEPDRAAMIDYKVVVGCYIQARERGTIGIVTRGVDGITRTIGLGREHRKGIMGERGVTAGFKAAKKQGCKIVVIDLDEHILQVRSFELSKYISRRKADFVSGMITACYVVFDGEAVVVNASVQTRQEIMSAIEMLNPGSSSY